MTKLIVKFLVCGIKNDDSEMLINQQILGGDKSDQHEWPWMVFINIASLRNIAAFRTVCGAVLISPR